MRPHSKIWILSMTGIIIILLIGILLAPTVLPLKEARPIESFSASNPATTMAAEDIVMAWLQQYKSSQMPLSMRISDYGILKTESMDAGTYSDYIRVQYWIRPTLPIFHIFKDWGEESQGKIICDRAVKVMPSTDDPNRYQITETGDYLTVQTSIQHQKRVEKDTLQNEYDIPHGFPQIQNTYYITDTSEVLISYDGGKNWSEPIPVTAEVLTNLQDEKYHNRLSEGSYYITPEITSFIYPENGFLWCCRSTDQGKNWKITSVSSDTYCERMILSGWTSDQEGWIIVGFDRQMATEAKAIFLTHDGGLTWENQGRGISDMTTRILKHGGFVSDKVGFLSFGPSNIVTGRTKDGYDIIDTSPDFYRTEDGGKTFSKIKLPIPEKYDAEIFVCAQAPKLEPDGTLSLLVDQGDSGDYQGGKVCLRFLSDDWGKTWNFDGEFTPEEISFGG